MKHYDKGASLSQRLLEGIDILADNVASTLGPRGRNVILYKKGASPIITKDGVTVSEFVHMDDEFENAAAQIIKQAAAQTNTMAGDGTTTATVLAREILVGAQRYITAGASPTELKRGIDAAVQDLTSAIRSSAIHIETLDDVENIATISANNDRKIGKLIATAVDKAGKDGAITIEESKTIKVWYDYESSRKTETNKT